MSSSQQQKLAVLESLIRNSDCWTDLNKIKSLFPNISSEDYEKVFLTTLHLKKSTLYKTGNYDSSDTPVCSLFSCLILFPDNKLEFYLNEFEKLNLNIFDMGLVYLNQPLVHPPSIYRSIFPVFGTHDPDYLYELLTTPLCNYFQERMTSDCYKLSKLSTSWNPIYSETQRNRTNLLELILRIIIKLKSYSLFKMSYRQYPITLRLELIAHKWFGKDLTQYADDLIDLSEESNFTTNLLDYLAVVGSLPNDTDFYEKIYIDDLPLVTKCLKTGVPKYSLLHYLYSTHFDKDDIKKLLTTSIELNVELEYLSKIYSIFNNNLELAKKALNVLTPQDERDIKNLVTFDGDLLRVYYLDAVVITQKLANHYKKTNTQSNHEYDFDNLPDIATLLYLIAVDEITTLTGIKNIDDLALDASELFYESAREITILLAKGVDVSPYFVLGLTNTEFKQIIKSEYNENKRTPFVIGEDTFTRQFVLRKD